jgi:transposase-like protein
MPEQRRRFSAQFKAEAVQCGKATDRVKGGSEFAMQELAWQETAGEYRRAGAAGRTGRGLSTADRV